MSMRPVYPTLTQSREAEGGCGVIGLAANQLVECRHLHRACRQMHNRGNGKGGGIAAVGLDADQLKVPQQVLDDCYLVQLAYLDHDAQNEVENEFIRPFFDVVEKQSIEEMEDYRDAGLTVAPPRVVRYFLRARRQAVEQFLAKEGAPEGSPEHAEDEFVYRNSYRLNEKFYVEQGQRAFVLSHGKNLLVFKVVGYAEQAVDYYRLSGLKAHVWIGHQRYPTKGKVWHPGGAHPFIGLHEALVHNGDLANFKSICDYLAQQRIFTLFQTDTEVGALLFDLYTRRYGYPLEYVIEALAPTTERDFLKLPADKREVYGKLQRAHIHGSPDGPWFFIVARNDTAAGAYQLIGITDTSMLRPQVFALKEEGGLQVGLVASEKQAIDATLSSMCEAGMIEAVRADSYWNARGGSYTDGGAFAFELSNGVLTARNKFGDTVTAAGLPHPVREPRMRRFEADDQQGALCKINYAGAVGLRAPHAEDEKLVIDVSGFAPEGRESIARFLIEAYQLGWKRFITYNWAGQRFCGCGFGRDSGGVRIDVYGSPGDYTASGIDGMEVRVFENGQDQYGNLMKSGKLVVYGDVGQAFMYGAKGGEAYVSGNVAGRALINAVSHPRVVINGTALDYLAESFMAGDPLNGGGFVILNAVEFDAQGALREKAEPYPGANLFSLASGGAVYIRDPHRRVSHDQLNGGEIAPIGYEDWEIMLPYLEENERIFGISVAQLLGLGDRTLRPEEAYIKVFPRKMKKSH